MTEDFAYRKQRYTPVGDYIAAAIGFSLGGISGIFLGLWIL